MAERHVNRGLLAVLCLLCAPVLAFAQYGAIAGVAKDTSGAVLPGVTVEAASPALIEKVRSVVTDDAGQYKLIDLRPGVYSVTFTLTGFASVRREGIELATGFTAPVNVEMQVGAVEETVVVSAQSPIVDVQNVREQRVITRDILDTIPTGKSFDNLGALIPGMSVAATVSGGVGQDVGGTVGQAYQRLAIHGGRSLDQQVLVDGLSIIAMHTSAGSYSFSTFGDGNIQETTIETGGHSAEAESGGVLVNIIPKNGGNTFTGNFFGSFGTKALQSNNYSADLRARGLLAPNRVKYLSDVNPSIGGPIARDKVWFFGGYRDLRRVNYVSDRYADSSATDWVYTPDLTRQPEDDQAIRDVFGRVTWQVTNKNKVSASYNYDTKHEGHFAVTPPMALQAVWNQTTPNSIVQATWTAAATNRLLLDVGASFYRLHFTVGPQDGAAGPSATDTATGVVFRAASSATAVLGYKDVRSANDFLKAAVSYVARGHASKFGVIFNPGHANFHFYSLADYEVRVLNGAPIAVTFLSTPYSEPESRAGKIAVFAQDQWTVRRLTLNGGLRFDRLVTSYPDYTTPATRLLPPRAFPGTGVLHWQDLSPRLGAAYDLFGNGRTALKVSVSRYPLQETIDLTRAISPATASAGSLTRTWNDADGNFVPQGDPLNPAANGELGPSPNNNFGRSVLTLRYDPDWANGFAVRPNQWEMSASVHHELVPRLSVDGGYFRRMYGNFTVTDNQLVTPSNYDPYCVTAPADARLPGGGGQQICGLFDLNPSRIGLVDNLRRSSDSYGKQTERWHGTDLTLNASPGRGVLLQGGVSTGRTETDNCDIVVQVDNPGTRFCHVRTAWLTQVKFLGTYTLPFQLELAGTFQSSPGAEISANHLVRSAQIAPSLGRNLSSGANGTVTINLIEPGTRYGDRLYQLDLRLARTFRASRVRIKGMVDLYNALNGNTVLGWNNSYGTNGASWLVPQSILSARLVKLGLQLNF